MEETVRTTHSHVKGVARYFGFRMVISIGVYFEFTTQFSCMEAGSGLLANDSSIFLTTFDFLHSSERFDRSNYVKVMDTNVYEFSKDSDLS